MSRIDRYPHLGPKRVISTWESVIDFVRVTYPNAYAEGSTGAERSWWIPGKPAIHIGHSWPINERNSRSAYFVRLARKETVECR
jgi:hypothetical protein